MGQRMVVSLGMWVVCLALGAAVHAQEASSLQEVPWQSGPVTGSLGSQSTVRVADGCRFADAAGTKAFLTLTQNPTGGSERGTVLCTSTQADGEDGHWFAVFDYSPSGYVSDDEKGALDADAILKSLREGNEESNEERKQRGWTTLSIEGWERAPYYDEVTNNLTWAVRVRSEDGSESINHSVRLLGREGVMKVDLVVNPAEYQRSLPQFSELIAAHDYNSGFRYAEWREGDKVASYGLTALIAGGAGAVAAKSGLLAKFWKVLVAVGVAIAASVRKLFSGSGRGETA